MERGTYYKALKIMNELETLNEQLNLIRMVAHKAKNNPNEEICLGDVHMNCDNMCVDVETLKFMAKKVNAKIDILEKKFTEI